MGVRVQSTYLPGSTTVLSVSTSSNVVPGPISDKLDTAAYKVT